MCATADASRELESEDLLLNPHSPGILHFVGDWEQSDKFGIVL